MLRVESVGDREALGAVWVDLLDRTEWLLAFTTDPDLAATAQSLAHESVPAPAATPSPARPAASPPALRSLAAAAVAVAVYGGVRSPALQPARVAAG